MLIECVDKEVRYDALYSVVRLAWLLNAITMVFKPFYSFYRSINVNNEAVVIN